MAQVAPIDVECVKVESIKALSFAAPQTTQNVRVTLNGYILLLFSLTFAASFLYYLKCDSATLILLVASWLFIPLTACFDSYEFDGQTLSRKGLIAFLYNKINRKKYDLTVSEIEMVETNPLLNIKIGGQIFSRYRTEIVGKNYSFTIRSNGKKQQQFVRDILTVVDDEKLDARSLDLRDYYIEPEKLNLKIAALQLPSSEFLESTSPEFRSSIKREVRESFLIASERSDNWRVKSAEMRQIASELRVAGKLAQSIEAFRRALLWQPKDAVLIYEFARCLLAYASVNQNEKAESRANAALRLAKIRGENNPELLTRIGEIYFNFDEFELAANSFKSALLLQSNNFRAERGMAETALQNGKLAHVVHHYCAASRSSQTIGARNWANNEADYFSKLNNDDNYLEKELSRISLIKHALQVKRICRQVVVFGLSLLLGGLVFDEVAAKIGWAFAGAAMFIFLVSIVVEKLYCQRSKSSE